MKPLEHDKKVRFPSKTKEWLQGAKMWWEDMAWSTKGGVRQKQKRELERELNEATAKED